MFVHNYNYLLFVLVITPRRDKASLSAAIELSGATDSAMFVHNYMLFVLVITPSRPIGLFFYSNDSPKRCFVEYGNTDELSNRLCRSRFLCLYDWCQSICPYWFVFLF